MAIIKKWWKLILVLVVTIICFVFACSVFKLVPAETEKLYTDVASKFIESKDFSLIPYGSELTIDNTESTITLKHLKTEATLKVFYNLNPVEYVWDTRITYTWFIRILVTILMASAIFLCVFCIIDIVKLSKIILAEQREKKIIKKDGDAYPTGYDIGYQDGFNKGRNKGYHKGIKDSRDDEYERGFEDGAEKAFSEVNDFNEAEENNDE